MVGLLFTGFTLVPSYQSMQNTVRNEFAIADHIGVSYKEGSIVCDIPSMVYSLSTRWSIEPEDIISNLYSPHCYDDIDPRSYLGWLSMEDITIWCYYGERGDTVWDILSAYPDLLVCVTGRPRSGFYMVDASVLDSLL